MFMVARLKDQQNMVDRDLFYLFLLQLDDFHILFVLNPFYFP